MNIKQMKRDAKRLKDEENIPLHEALDRIAKKQGFKDWAELMFANWSEDK